MPRFTYTALTKDGKIESATIEAVSETEVGHNLKAQGLIPTTIKEDKPNSFLSSLKAIGTVPLAEKVIFVQNLSIMIKSGIAAPKAIKIMARQTKSKKFQECLNDVAGSVESGKSLGEAMAKYPRIFSNIFISMVKVGELSGNLDKSLEYLGIQLQREANLRSKTKGALIYPAVIVFTMILVGILMSAFVLPKLTATFEDMGGELPFMTKVVIALGKFMEQNIVLVFIGLIVLGVLAYMGFKTPTGKRIFHAFLLKFLIINTIVKKINLARFARIMSSLLKSGTPILEGIEVTGQSIDNIYYKEVLLEAGKNVKLGKPLTETLSKYEKLFPYIVVQMLEVGEDTGSVETILEQLAEHFEMEVDDTMRNLSSVIEPLLLLVIGGVVGLLAVALISPIYNIGGSIK